MSAGVQARVLIVARDDSAAGPLAEGLDRLGWRTVTARSEVRRRAALSDLQIQAAIVDLCHRRQRDGHHRRLRASCHPRRLPIMGMGEPDPFQNDHGFDLTLAGPLHPAQAAMRLETLVRTAVAEEEFEVRVETFAERACVLDAPETDGPPYRILAIGEPAPAVPGALQRLQPQRRRGGRRLHRLHRLRLPARAAVRLGVLVGRGEPAGGAVDRRRPAPQHPLYTRPPCST
jgi:two-component system cell cycle response regulator PopA